MRNLGTYPGGVMTLGGGGSVPNSMRIVDKAAVASGGAKLESELEKKDPILKEPLSSVTYTRDIPITTGGGWVDTISHMYVQYGVMDGSDEGLAAASGATESAIIQANIADQKWGAHVFDITMRVDAIDQLRGKLTNRNVEDMYREGIRLSYDKHNEMNGYLGMKRFGTCGSLNSPDVAARLVKAGSGGGTTFIGKEADEILFDINDAIVTNWNRAENDLSALPNHILMPHDQLNYIITTKVSHAADKSILTYIEENNLVRKQQGGNLFIGATNFCKGIGTGGTDRMAVYSHNKRFLKMEELVGLTRLGGTVYNPDKKSYDSRFVANISQVQILYLETIGYYDGI